MTTSVLMAAATDHETTNPSGLPPFRQDHQPIRRSSGRRKSSKMCESSSSSAAAGGQKKKQPQRGMGVEKLERLRLQESWGKMKEINTTTNNQPALSNISHVVADPTNLIINNSSSLSVHHRLSSKLCGCGYGFGYGSPNVGLTVMNQNLSSFSSDFRGKSIVMSGFSKELPSIPNVVNCYSQHCNACHKKKKVSGENLGSSESHKQMCNVGDCRFLELNMGYNHNIINQENQVFETKINRKQGVDVVAVHRKAGSSSSQSGSVVEYDFFPSSGKAADCCTNESQNDVLKMFGASKTSSSMAGFDSSNYIDLSLRLSY